MSNQQLPKVISLENGKLTRFKTTIEFKKAQLTGILAVKQINDTLNAVFLNEFGIKGFTFSIINNKCKVDNLLGPMNKWYIRKTLASDFNCIFSVEQNLIVTESRIADSIILFNSGEKVIGRLTLQADSSIVFENIKHNIFYKMSIIH